MQKNDQGANKIIPDATNLLQEGTKNTQNFITKFNNDWVMSSAAGLAYNLILSIIPIAIALIAMLGFTVGRLTHESQAQLAGHIQHLFPSVIPSTNVLQLALTTLSKNAGFLGFIAVVTAIFGGSRLFITIEGYFAIIYRTYSRKIIAQNVMAILMLLIYIALTPVMVFASSVPALMLSLVQNSKLVQLPGVAQLTQNSVLLSAASILGSLIVSWILLEAIYLVVPHRKISFTRSWQGATVGAFLLQFFLFLFPLYITHFMGSYTGEAGFVVIFLLFFYYFAVILLLGAEINAYFAEGIPPLPKNVAAVIHDACRKEENDNKKPGGAHSPPGGSGQR